MRDELARVLGYPLIAARLAQNGRDAEGVLAAFDRRVEAGERARRRARPASAATPTTRSSSTSRWRTARGS